MTIRINTVYTKQYQPFIKWVGGKRGLLKQLLEKFPKKFENYHEPFLGGGAVFFELYSQGLLKDKKIYLSDINTELVNTYNVVKSNPYKLIDSLEEFKEKHNKEFYYQVREIDRQENFKSLTDIERATRFIYLNKTCFNGLYRVNKKGYFNTPIGSYKNPNIADRDTILSASEALQNAIISNKSFCDVINNASKNDLVYFDPPYYPLTTTANFTAYNENDFLDDKQKELFKVFEKLNKKECFVLHSNSDTDFIKDLYQDHSIDFVQANRFINSKSSGRGKINEVLISSRNISANM
ncbi:MAG: DNA adenine methylase [Campylobacterota bacterium]|nr:DNA adenine methylase [Campylobacterota bacterium]